MAVSGMRFATPSCTHAVQEFLAGVTPTHVWERNFTCPEVGENAQLNPLRRANRLRYSMRRAAGKK
jgi:hypothetical protein